ncbi:MAG: hypothetical protein QOH48_1825 [Actinomycetota bacterium]|jgi:hypothetical protein|nr:hypothetical protein [Actinomycetota bacterium]
MEARSAAALMSPAARAPALTIPLPSLIDRGATASLWGSRSAVATPETSTVKSAT